MKARRNWNTSQSPGQHMRDRCAFCPSLSLTNSHEWSRADADTAHEPDVCCAIHTSSLSVLLLPQLMQQVAAVYEGETVNGKAPEADALAERLVQLGYSVTVRTALGGGGGCECLRNLRHVFLCVRMPVRSAPSSQLCTCPLVLLCVILCCLAAVWDVLGAVLHS